MKVLILGGSGILSADFTKKTLDEHNEVTIVNRGKRKLFIDDRAELVIADIRNETVEQLSKKINIHSYDVVIDFLSFVPEHIEKVLSILQSNFKQYIFISSATVYIKRSENEIITEKSAIGNKIWDYAYRKYECECYLTKQNINYTIIRPYVTYGASRIPFPIIPSKYQYSLIARIKESKPVALFNDGAAICTLTHTKDFAEILYRLLLNEKAFREAFHITSNSVQSWKDVYLMICDNLKIKPNYFSVNINQVEKYIPEFRDILLGDKGTNMRFDNSKVVNVIGGYEFKVTLREGLERSIQFYENCVEMQGVDFKWDGRIDYMFKKCINNGPRLHILSTLNSYSKDRSMYYVMTNSMMRFIYDELKVLKRN